MISQEPLPSRSQVVQRHMAELGRPVEIQVLPNSTRTAAEAAKTLGCQLGAIASSLLFVADGEPLLVMTSGRHRVDTDLLAENLGLDTIAMATASLVRETTGQVIGGVAPVGHPAPVRTLVDEALREHETIWTAAGTPHTVMPMTFDDLLHITSGTVVRVAAD